MTYDEQIKLWIDGHSKCPNEQGECCPDFSCCKPTLQAPAALRARFAIASTRDRNAMLLHFLGAFAALMDSGVHVAGSRPQ